ncbi:aminoglycoside phosphotransferase family protein [Streptomyces sp. NPDC048282]|uniref:aminoglycoside phosphotransferase family protein n=1 Tax=Streptomyces sp. NPDC048282 TaxID=3365528 RepID=UPI00371F1460
MSHPLPRRAHLSLVRIFAEARRRSPDGEVVSGHHNVNRIAELRQPLAYLLGKPSGRLRAKFRTPFPTVEVVPRIWPHEAHVLRALEPHVRGVPRCLVDFGEWSLHEYIVGQTLVDVVPEGPIGSERLMALAEFFASLATVGVGRLPPLPSDWPRHTDSRGFLEWIAQFAKERVQQANEKRFGELFGEIGVPADAIDRFMSSVPSLTPRPFILLHTDVHRANVVVVPTPGGEYLSVIDWELSLFGDPLHDLATHLVRMNYDKAEQELMVRMWADAMCRAGRDALCAGLDDDLPVYLDFEYAQSVFPDVMRAALDLPILADDRDLGHAAGRICQALLRAREPLGLVDGRKDERAVVDALRRWQATEGTRWVGVT